MSNLSDEDEYLLIIAGAIALIIYGGLPEAAGFLAVGILTFWWLAKKNDRHGDKIDEEFEETFENMKDDFKGK